jgi:hypothetical protein
VVEKGEYDDIVKTGMLNIPFGLEMKQFWFNTKDANNYAYMLSQMSDGTPYAQIKIIVNKSTVEMGYIQELDGMMAVTFTIVDMIVVNNDIKLNGGIKIIKRY